MSAPREAREALLALDRRGFLRLAGVAGAAGLLPTGCGGAPERLRPPPEVALQVLEPRSYATLTAGAARIVGGEGGRWILEGRARPALAVDALLARTPAVGAVLSQGLLVLEFGFFPLLPKLRPFTALSGEGQDGVLHDLAHASAGWKRDLFRGLKSLVAASFYADPIAHPLIHYPGPFGSGSSVDATIADAMTYDPEP